MKTSYLYPVAASTHAHAVDRLLAVLLGSVVGISVLIALVLLVFVVRYRSGRPGPRKPQPGHRVVLACEIGWTLAPIVVSIGIFFWASSLYVQGAVFPPRAEEVLVVAKQWMWKVQHESGAREIDELHVPLGRDVKLVMTSQDVIHSFYVPAFRVKQDVLPKRYTFMWFRATRVGTYHLYCAEYCGMQHSRMRGKVVVMEPSDYERWLAAQGTNVSARDAGAAHFVQFGCVSCHRSDLAHRAPVLEGVYGSRVLLADGSAVTADEEYLRESIVTPVAKIVAGYTPIMPDYSKSLSDMQVMELVAYIESLGQRHEAGHEEGARDE
jgi:cytochrome c oxidase subunit 2